MAKDELRACIKSPFSRTAQASGHQIEHGQIDHGLAGLGQFFIVFAETAIPSQPSEGPFHHPPVGEYGETGDVVASFDDFQHPTAKLKRPVNQLPRITAVSPDRLETTELTFDPSSTVLGQVNPRGCSETRIFEQNQPRSLKT